MPEWSTVSKSKGNTTTVIVYYDCGVWDVFFFQIIYSFVNIYAYTLIKHSIDLFICIRVAVLTALYHGIVGFNKCLLITI